MPEDIEDDNPIEEDYGHGNSCKNCGELCSQDVNFCSDECYYEYIGQNEDGE